MSMQPRPWPEVPKQTARMARAAFRKGNLATRIRDELGQVYEDGRFTAVFGVRGRPGISPAQLMIVSVLQFAEDLTDRQAAEAVRDRITWKYALGLELDDPGFDASVLSEFRARLVDGELSSLALDALLQRLAALKLVKAAGRQRTDSTHVLAAIRRLNRLELAGETVRAALEALSAAAPDWLTTVIDASWLDVYGARIDNLRLPASQTRRDELLLQYGRDGYHLLDAVHQPDAPPWLAEIPAVQALRRIWIQQFCGDTDSSGRREVRRRDPAPSGDGVPPARDRIASPYEHDARYATKRGKAWTGYKVHLTETCDPPEPRTASGSTGRGDHPNLITNVVTTAASTADNAMTATIHQQLADKNLTPAEHLVDSGYPSAHQRPPQNRPATPRPARSRHHPPHPAEHQRMENPLPHPRRHRRHHPPNHPRHRHPHRPLPRPAQNHPRTHPRRHRHQHHPPRPLLDRQTPQPHPHHPPPTPQLHPRRLTTE
ncbi:hypothetical protein AMIS_22110 [Actinoplanes missouriensis 431]|uniref:Transposase InsH N-terminal domain-containing protein n=1 Tax=Actinoplanes missouriensis (strain ATCC 14538 / DSM 43046 / CBS 188.64 / JCM 3121 / NBRC 102363 / NCIMB 12654 / NRRL B-3342 / UNCC 431) TaxID=512565 RepID=I0H344_ACTM4|nr:hypothetical protein AMIS_22110 [Actinoplanes missouriensis 431]